MIKLLLAVLEASISGIANTSLVDTGAELVGLRKILKQVEEGSITTVAELDKAVGEALLEQKKCYQENGAQDAFKVLRDEVQTLGQQVPTQFTKNSKSVQFVCSRSSISRQRSE